MLFPFLIFAIVLNAALGDKIKNPYGSAIINITNSVILINNVSTIPPK
jgi:peptide/nickel transport system permease protein